MKYLVLASISVFILAATTAEAMYAQTVALPNAITDSTSNSKLTPANLVILAHRGYFKP